jgi:hypothetical protein
MWTNRTDFGAAGWAEMKLDSWKVKSKLPLPGHTNTEVDCWQDEEFFGEEMAKCTLIHAYETRVVDVEWVMCRES